MAETVTFLVPPTVKTTHVTYKTGLNIRVNPAGRKYRVKQVRRTMYIEFNNSVSDNKLIITLVLLY